MDAAAIAFWIALAALHIMHVSFSASLVAFFGFCQLAFSFQKALHVMTEVSQLLCVPIFRVLNFMQTVLHKLPAFPALRVAVSFAGHRQAPSSFRVQILHRISKPDLMGVTGPCEVGSKQWFDSILAGLAARHLKPPLKQVRMLVDNEQTFSRLQNASTLKHQLDIICGAAYKAQLAWQKTTAADSMSKDDEVQTWRLRTRDWKISKPASEAEAIVSAERSDAFRAQADGDPLGNLWSRKPGAYFICGSEAARVVRSIPAHAPPPGLFSLITLQPTPRSEANPVETLVVHPDNSHHMVKVYLTHLGTEKLSPVDWTTVSPAAIESVEILLEWWRDMTDGDAILVFDELVKLASKPGHPASEPAKGKGRSKGKTKESKPHRLSDILVANLNQQFSCLLGDSTRQKIGSWKPAGHSVREDIIRISVRVPKADVLSWLKSGTPHHAILARDIHELPDAQDLCIIWISPGCPVLEGSATQIRQSLSLYLAGFKAPWSVVRTPYRWGIRTQKEHEREVKAIVQPNSVFVPAVVVATLTTAEFKPYLVSSHRGSIIIAASSQPADIVFNIKELKCTLLLQLIPGATVPGKLPAQQRHVEGASPRRKTRRADSAEQGAAPGDTKGGGPGHLPTSNRFGVLDETYQVDFPPLPSRSGPVCGSGSPGLGVLPNLGNTCFAAVAIRCLSHIVQHSQIGLTAIRDSHLRSLLMDLSPSQWESFCQHNKLVKGLQQDAVLWLQQYLDSEPVFHPLVSMSECLGLTCVGCGEPKMLESSFPVWQIPVPTEPLSLRELVACQCHVVQKIRTWRSAVPVAMPSMLNAKQRC